MRGLVGLVSTCPQGSLNNVPTRACVEVKETRRSLSHKQLFLIRRETFQTFSKLFTFNRS